MEEAFTERVWALSFKFFLRDGFRFHKYLLNLRCDRLGLREHQDSGIS